LVIGGSLQFAAAPIGNKNAPVPRGPGLFSELTTF